MAFRVSPGVNITEKDLTNIVPAVATTPGGFVGNFHWGPCEDIVTIPSENELARLYGKPTNENYMDFYSAANFLSYGNNCKVLEPQTLVNKITERLLLNLKSYKDKKEK